LNDNEVKLMLLTELNVAVTLFVAVSVTRQKLPFTLSHPVQTLSVWPGAGTALSVI
jgi:hypothetical protein